MSVNVYNSQSGSLQTVANGQRTWVGTRAAYDQAKMAGTLPNNALIAITDDEHDYNHYSTDEVFTGMYWIDGKPIYRKVFTGGKSVANGNVYNVNDLNIENIINFYGSFGSGYFINATANDNYICTSINGGYIKTICSSTWVNVSITVIIEYTKTTD